MDLNKFIVVVAVLLPIIIGYFVCEWFAMKSFANRYFILNPNQLNLRLALIMLFFAFISFCVWLACYWFVL